MRRFIAALTLLLLFWARPAVADGCKFQASGSVSTLVKTAVRQTIELAASDPTCFQQITKATALVASTATIPIQGDSGTKRLVFPKALPTGLQTGDTTWTLQDMTGTSLGTLQISLGDLAVDNKGLGIRYDSATIRHSGQSAMNSDSSLGIAVVGFGIQNQARLVVPPGLPATSSIAQWEVAATTWGTDVAFDGCSSGTGSLPCALNTIERIDFRVAAPQTTPLVVTLRLWPAKQHAASDQPLAEIRVTLAASARRETVPVQFKPAMSVVCNGEGYEAHDGDTIAITGDEITLNSCRVVFTFADLKIDPDVLDQYGIQPFVVHVHKDGTDSAKDGEALWLVDTDRRAATYKSAAAFAEKFNPSSGPTSQNEELGLPTPDVDASGDAFYEVTVRLKVPPPSAVFYRDQSIDQSDASTRDVFKAKLKLRGAYAWKSNFRTFVTIPVNATAIRFGASSVDLRSSSSSTRYETVPFTAGVLLGIEQWDYRVGRNTWAIPVRALVGMQLINLTNTTFAPSTLVGLSATWPVVESPSALGSSLALGIFWEVDLREPHPIEHGGHALLTLGFNFFSLGSPSTPKP